MASNKGIAQNEEPNWSIGYLASISEIIRKANGYKIYDNQEDLFHTLETWYINILPEIHNFPKKISEQQIELIKKISETCSEEARKGIYNRLHLNEYMKLLNILTHLADLRLKKDENEKPAAFYA